MKDFYPITIIKSRYGGAYEGAEWIAINEHAYTDTVYKMEGGDLQCNEIFSLLDNPKVDIKNWFERKTYIGRGKTPQEAYVNLVEKLKGVEED